MRRLLFGLIPAFLLIFAGSAAVAQGDATPEAAKTTTVMVRQSATLGPHLTDAKGMTLYLFTKDTEKGVSTCYDKCEANWPIFRADEPLTLPDGVAGELTTITRTDGTKQVAYNGIPLYYFAKDVLPGDTNGQDVGEVWYVVTPGMEFGQPYASPVASPVASPSASTGNNVTVTVSEFFVQASTTTFKAGETYTLTITNAGSFPHEMIVEPGGAVDQPIEVNGQETEAEEIQPGETRTLEVVFPEAGAYQLACHLRGHYAQGMALSIVVTD